MRRFATQSALPLSQLPGVSGDGSTLVMEFAAILRRALTQQAPVRQALYRGVATVLQADPASVTVLLPLLYPRLQACVRGKVCCSAPCSAVSCGVSCHFVYTVNSRKVAPRKGVTLAALARVHLGGWHKLAACPHVQNHCMLRAIAAHARTFREYSLGDCVHM